MIIRDYLSKLICKWIPPNNPLWYIDNYRYVETKISINLHKINFYQVTGLQWIENRVHIQIYGEKWIILICELAAS